MVGLICLVVGALEPAGAWLVGCSVGMIGFGLWLGNRSVVRSLGMLLAGLGALWVVLQAGILAATILAPEKPLAPPWWAPTVSVLIGIGVVAIGVWLIARSARS